MALPCTGLPPEISVAVRVVDWLVYKLKLEGEIVKVVDFVTRGPVNVSVVLVLMPSFKTK